MNEESKYVLREYEIHHDTNEEYEAVIVKNVTELEASQRLHEVYKEYLENPEVVSADFEEDEELEVPDGASRIISAFIDFKNGTTLEFYVGTGYQDGEEEDFNAMNDDDYLD